MLVQRAGIAEVGEFGIRQPVADAKFKNVEVRTNAQ